MEENFFSSEPNHHFQVQAVNLWGVYVVCRSWEKAGQDLSSQLNPLILRFQVLTAGINLGDLMIRPTCSILKLPLTSPMDWTSGLSCCQFGAAAQGVEEDPKSRCSKRWNLSFQHFFMFTPNVGEMLQFDGRILFKWVGSTTNYCSKMINWHEIRLFWLTSCHGRWNWF